MLLLTRAVIIRFRPLSRRVWWFRLPSGYIDRDSVNCCVIRALSLLKSCQIWWVPFSPCLKLRR